MNDHEFRARLRKLREPIVDESAAAAALEKSLSALGTHERNHTSVPAASSSWSWRDWLWPSPLAWGALAAVWVGIAATDSQQEAVGQSRSALTQGPSPEIIEPYSFLVAHREYRELLLSYQKTTKFR